MDQVQPLRQPRTFWQWLSGQEGTLFVPLAPIVEVESPRTALDVIECELERLHDELVDYKEQHEYSGDDDEGYHRLLDSLDKVNGELIRRSQQESSSGPIPS